MPASRNARPADPLLTDPLLKECALFDVQRAARVMSSLYNAHLRGSGITVAQYSLMRSIEELQPVGIARLASAMAMERTSITRIIEPLIMRGMVQTSAGEDRRVRNVELTAQGAKVLRRAKARWERAQRELLGTLGRTQWVSMRDALRATVRKVRERNARA